MKEHDVLMEDKSSHSPVNTFEQNNRIPSQFPIELYLLSSLRIISHYGFNIFYSSCG